MHKGLMVIPFVLSVGACGDVATSEGRANGTETDGGHSATVIFDASFVVPYGDDDDSNGDAGEVSLDTDAEVGVNVDAGPPVATPFGDDDDDDGSTPGNAADDAGGSAPPPASPLRDCGDILIKAPSDVIAAQDCRTAKRVDISFGPFAADEDGGAAPPLAAIDLPHLKSASTIFVSQANLTSLSLGELTSVSGHFYIDRAVGLQSVDASQLAQVGEYLYITNNASLVTLDLAHLTTVGQYIYVTNNAELSALSFADVTQVGPSPNADVLYFANNPAWCPPTTTTMATLANGGGYHADGDGCGR